MNKLLKSSKIGFMLILSVIFLVACGGSNSSETDETNETDQTETTETTSEVAETSSEEPQVVKIGIRSSGIDMVEAFRENATEAGFEIETTVFDDAVQPNVAIDEGSADINFFQHEQYMESFNESEGTTLHMVKPTVYYGVFAIFSDKISAYDELEDGATLTVSNDPSNQDRALRMLHNLDLLTVDLETELLTIHDIQDNPKNLQFNTANNSLIPQSIPDVDAVVCASTHVMNAGMDPEDYLIETSTDGDEYRVGFVVDESNADEAWVEEFVDAALSEGLYEYISERGTDVPMFEYDDSGNREIMDEALE